MFTIYNNYNYNDTTIFSQYARNILIERDVFRTKYGQTSEKITKNYDIIIV